MNNSSSNIINYDVVPSGSYRTTNLNNSQVGLGVGVEQHVGGSNNNNNNPNKPVTQIPTGYSFIWYAMIQKPLPFLFVLPLIYAIFTSVGWTRPNFVETEVSQIWIPKRGQYAQDWQYASLASVNVNGTNFWDQSIFAAMAIGKDHHNLLNQYDLETIRQRMQSTEQVTVTYKGNNYTWDDICAETPAPYQMPCARLSPMDLWYEARWFFTETDRLYWYNELIIKQLAMPRINRFGVLFLSCNVNETTVCQDLINYRYGDGDPNSTTSYNPSALIKDVGNLEMSDPCRICLEDNYTKAIDDLYNAWNTTLTILDRELNRTALNDGTLLFNMKDYLQLKQLQKSISDLIVKNFTKNDIEEFYYYYTIRDLYAKLGWPTYMANYGRLNELFTSCIGFGAALGFTYCPPINTSKDEAIQALYNHADHTFSSIVTSGVPYPMYGAPGDGTTYLLMGNEPVSGSGVNMSANLTSVYDYFDIKNYNVSDGANNTFSNTSWFPPFYTSDGFINLTAPEFDHMILHNPMFSWFAASLDQVEGFKCGNGYLLGTKSTSADIDNRTNTVARNSAEFWCNEYTVPNDNNTGTGNYTRQYFAKMWYNGLLTSESLLDISIGHSDPFSWTTGAGCGYKLHGERNRYTNMSEDGILFNASRYIYMYDEGVVLGVVQPELLIGNSTPRAGQYSFEYPLETVGVLQSIYAAAQPYTIAQRVRSCQRPGGPLQITRDDAKQVLYLFKQAMEETWSKGWDDPTQNISFVCLYDDSGAGGTAARILQAVTLDNTALVTISMALIAVFSILFLVSFDVVESRVLIALIGVSLCILGYFAGLGFGILLGMKINISVAWSLPFILIGLGVHDVYIILMALKRQKGYTDNDFINTMKEIVIPVSMTALVNIMTFLILNISDVPAIYVTARMAILCLLFLYWSHTFCFPAYAYLDLKRQALGRYDILFCFQRNTYAIDDNDLPDKNVDDCHSTLLYDYFYRPLMLSDNDVWRKFVQSFTISAGVSLFIIGCIGISQHQVGVGLEELFPNDNQAQLWASERTEALASWSIQMQWGELDYTDPDIQMQMMKQFEDVASTSRVADIDTKQLWIAEFAIWASRLCEENVRRRDNFDTGLCGQDQIFKDEGTVCSATWKLNTFGLREKHIQSFDNDTCYPAENGVCRLATELHPDDLKEIIVLNPKLIVNQTMSFCPTIDNWSIGKWQFCLVQWRNITGSTNGGLVVQDDGSPSNDCPGATNNDNLISWPISFSAGPTMFAYDLFTHADTLAMMNDTRHYCDHNPIIHCWMWGIPYKYWTQYVDIMSGLTKMCVLCTLVGFVVSFLFLFITINMETLHERPKIFLGTFIGSILIAATVAFGLVVVIGLSILSGVRLSGFSNMSFVLSVAFTVDYSIHIVSRWLRIDLSEKTSLGRVRATMSFLMLPTFMAFASSTIGVICLAFSQFYFVQVYFFKPLIIVMFVTYFFGCYWLPAVLALIDIDSVKLGKPIPTRTILVTQSRDGESTALSRQDRETQVGMD